MKETYTKKELIALRGVISDNELIDLLFDKIEDEDDIFGEKNPSDGEECIMCN